jgi:hypothetical protein
MKKENIQTRNRKPNVRRGREKSDINLQFASFLLKSSDVEQSYMNHTQSTANNDTKYFNLAYQFNHQPQQDFQQQTQMVPNFPPGYHNPYTTANSSPNSFLAARNVAAVAAAAAAAATAAVNSTQFISQSQLSSSPLSTSSSLLSSSISPSSATTVPPASATTSQKQKQSAANSQHPQIHHHHHHHHPTAFLNLSSTANAAVNVRDYDQISCY